MSAPHEANLRCPTCGARGSRVVDSRGSAEGDLVRRRRICQGCQGRFTTYEAVEHPAVSLKRWEAIREPLLEMVATVQRLATEGPS